MLGRLTRFFSSNFETDQAEFVQPNLSLAVVLLLGSSQAVSTVDSLGPPTDFIDPSNSFSTKCCPQSKILCTFILDQRISPPSLHSIIAFFAFIAFVAFIHESSSLSTFLLFCLTFGSFSPSFPWSCSTNFAFSSTCTSSLSVR